MMSEAAANSRFERFYREYREPVERYFYRLVGNREIAEDLCQETFLKVLRHKADLVAIDHATAWLYRIARNTAHDHFRRQGRIRLMPLEAPLDEVELGDPAARLATDHPREQPGSASIDAAIDVRNILDQLPDHKRNALMLFYLAGYSVAEIARLTATEPGTARSRLFRAREQFRLIYAV